MSDLDPAVIARARTLLGHAAVQRMADVHGTAVLHIKGYALDPSLVRPNRVSTDVDILVQPAAVERFVQHLLDAGWEQRIGFEAGSPFGHAATLHHPTWGYTDVHRRFPGVTVPPAEAFDTLWRGRTAKDIAGFPCAVPSLTAQIVILLLHAARSDDRARAQGDTDLAWGSADQERRALVRELVGRLGAQVAFAAAIGELDAHRHDREYLLWRSVSQGSTRAGEWWARIRAARTPLEALGLIMRAPLVNVEHLAAVLGRRPTRAEIVAEFFARPRRGLDEYLRARGKGGGSL